MLTATCTLKFKGVNTTTTINTGTVACTGFFVGADRTDHSGKTNAGKSYVIFGKTDPGAIDLSKLGDESKYTIDYLGDKNCNKSLKLLILQAQVTTP
jgi:hypothetical protein